MSDIFLAKALGAGGFQKPLIIKKLLPEFSAKPRYVQRFINEAQTLSRLNHSNIVQILDMGNIGSEYYLALEYIEGRNIAYLISRALKHGKLPGPAFAVHVAMELAMGLDYAHRRKGVNGENLMMVHQDVNAFNLMVSYEAEVKIIDFGIARVFLDKGAHDGHPVAGKLLYFSPEQLQRKPLDRRVDVYGAGILLYELLTGERLVDHQETINDTVRTILEMDIEKKVTENEKVPKEFRPTLIKAMALNPQDRYPWMDAFAEDLRRLAKDLRLDLNRHTFITYLKELFPREILLDRRRLRKLLADENGGKLPSKARKGTDYAGDAVLLEELLSTCAHMPTAEQTDLRGGSTFCKTLKYAAGQNIFEQEEFAGDMYVIKSGTVRIYLKIGKLNQYLHLLRKGDFFGESYLLGDPLRNTTAMAETDCELIAIDRETFVHLSRQDLAPLLLMNVVTKLRDRTYLFEGALLEDDLSRWIYALLYFHRKQSLEENKDIRLSDVQLYFRLQNTEELQKYVDKLTSLDVIEVHGEFIRVNNADKLADILNILAGRGKFTFKL